MKATLARRLSLAGVLLATVALPGTAPAQYHLPTLVSSVKADSLHDAAVALVAAGRWRDAARLYRRSAELRTADDPLGFRCLTEAAALAYATGDHSTARADMAKAAGHALARGDLRGGGARVPGRSLDRAGAEEAAPGLGAGPSCRTAGRLAAPRCARSSRDSSADQAGAGAYAVGVADGAVVTGGPLTGLWCSVGAVRAVHGRRYPHAAINVLANFLIPSAARDLLTQLR